MNDVDKEKNTVINANFFWHGPALSLYETACLSSFVNHHCRVLLHTFNKDLQVPEGVELCDASELADEAEVFAYTQGGHKNSVAAFTDIFRYRVLSRQAGWWFDTDVFCLKDASFYLELQAQSKGILLGLEEPGKVNGAVFYVSNPDLAKELERRANLKGKVLDAWGEIGPQLVTQFIREFPERVTVLPQKFFYPIHYLEVARFFRPQELPGCLEAAEEAVCVHLWNEFLRRWHIPKNILPCEGSYLGQLFSDIGITVAPSAALPNDSFEALLHNGQIGRLGIKALNSIRAIKRFKESTLGR